MNYKEKLQPHLLDNKYSIWYLNIIHNSAIKVKSKDDATNLYGYAEAHHILPRCLCGSDDEIKDPDNLVYLSAKEHFICHWLLCKATHGATKVKMMYAFNQMTIISESQSRYTSRNFAVARKYLGEASKITNTGKVFSQEHKDRISVAKTGTKMSQKTKNTQSIRMTGQPRPHSYSKKMSEKIWINDGTNNKRIANIDDIQPGWVVGRLFKHHPMEKISKMLLVVEQSTGKTTSMTRIEFCEMSGSKSSNLPKHLSDGTPKRYKQWVLSTLPDRIFCD